LNNEFIRINADFVDEKRFLLRVQNVHRLQEQTLQIQ